MLTLDVSVLFVIDVHRSISNQLATCHAFLNKEEEVFLQKSRNVWKLFPSFEHFQLFLIQSLYDLVDMNTSKLLNDSQISNASNGLLEKCSNTYVLKNPNCGKLQKIFCCRPFYAIFDQDL